MVLSKVKGIQRRHRRVRKKVVGTAARPRLAVFSSNRHIYAQMVDDTNARTLVAVSDAEVKSAEGTKATKTDIAREVGKVLAKKALSKKVKEVVFDRGGRLYHGRVKALAEGAREGGLVF